MRVPGKIFRYFPFSVKCAFVDLMLKMQGIEIKIAKTKEELEQVYRLRFKVYKDEDYIEPQDYPDGMLKDKYDEYSISFLALKNKEPIGAVRLVRYSQLGFPTEHSFNILEYPCKFPNEEMVEASKLCLKNKFRDGIVSLCLLKKAFEYSQKQNIQYWLFFTTKKLANYYEDKLGISLHLLLFGSLSAKHIGERKIAAKKYFQRFELHPYIVKLEEVKKT